MDNKQDQQDKVKSAKYNQIENELSQVANDTHNKYLHKMEKKVKNYFLKQNEYKLLLLNQIYFQNKRKVQELDNRRDSMSLNSGDINQLNLQYYLKSSREQLELLDSQNVIRNKASQRRGDIFTKQNDSENADIYKYNPSMNIKTEGSNPDQFQDLLYTSTFYPQSPENLTLAQLTSKSFFINNIMKKDSKELIEYQKQISKAVNSSTNFDQVFKLTEGISRKKKNLSNQLSFDQQKLQNNNLNFQNQNEKSQFISKRNELISSETNRKKINKTRNIQSQIFQNKDDGIQTLKTIPQHQFQKRKPSALASFITTSESQSTKAISNSTTKVIQSKTSTHSSNHASPQNEIIKQRESVFSFGKKQSLKNITGQNYLPDLNNKSASNQQIQQNKSRKSLAQQHLSGILMNTQFQQPQQFSTQQQQNQQFQYQNFSHQQQQNKQNSQSLGSFNQIGTLNSLSQRNKQNYILIGKKNQQNSFSQRNSNQFSRTSYNDLMYQSTQKYHKHQNKKYNVLNNYMNPADTDDIDTDDYNENIKDQYKQKNIQEDAYGQKFIKRNDGLFKTQENDENNEYQLQQQQNPLKSLNPYLTNYPSEQFINQGVLNTQFKPIESLSFYYQNKNPNQTDLVSEKTNLNAPNDPLLKKNSYEDGKWKIEKSDNVDMEASRKFSSTTTLSPFKVQYGNQSSLQTSQNQFFPLPNLNIFHENSPSITKNEYQNINNSSSLEINKKIQLQHQRSSSEDSQFNKNDKQISNQIQISSTKDIPLIATDNITQNEITQNSKILKEYTVGQASSKSIIPIIQDEQRQINRQASSSLSLQVSQYNTDNLKSDKEAIQSQSLMKQFSNQQQSSSTNNLIIKSKSNQTLILNMVQGSEKEINSLNFDKESTNKSVNTQQQNQIINGQDTYNKKQTLEKTIENNIDNENNNQTYTSVSSIKIKDIIDSRNSSESKNSYQSKESREYKRIINNKESGDIKESEKGIKSNEIKSQSQNSKISKQSQNSFRSSLNHLSSGYESMNEDKNLQISSIIVTQNKNQLKQESQYSKDVQTKSMATVLEKSENLSERTIPTQENIGIISQKSTPKKVDFQSNDENLQVNSPMQTNINQLSYNQSELDMNTLKNNQLTQKSNQSPQKENSSNLKQNITIQVQNNKENGSEVKEKLSSLSEIESPIKLHGQSGKQNSQSLKYIGSNPKINSQQRIDHQQYSNKSSIKQIQNEEDQGSNKSVKKRRSLSEQDVISQKFISFENPQKIDMALIIQQQSEKNINGNNSQEVSQYNEKTVKSQIRTRSETFKGKQDDELQINVVPPDNCTPLSNRSILQSQFNFVDMVQIADNQNYINPGNQYQKSQFGSQNQQSEQNNQINNGNEKNNQVNENNNNVIIESPKSESQINKATNSNNSPRIVNNSQTIPQNRISINITSINNSSGQYGVIVNPDPQNTASISQSTNNMQSDSSSTFNQDDQSQRGSKNNISPSNKSFINFQKQQQKFERDNVKGNEKLSEQQLNILNNQNYQKLIRTVKSSDDSSNFNQIGEEQKNNDQKEEQHSNTTKNSTKKSEGIDQQSLNFQNEIDKSNNTKTKNLKKLSVNTNINSSGSPLQNDKSKNSKRPSFDGTNSRRSSVLTPQQIKHIKKESRFYNKMSVYNKSFIDSEDPVLMDIYGQENTQFAEINDICDFKEFTPSSQNFFKDDENALIDAILNGNQESSQFTQSQQREINFKKLIYQINHSKQNPYIEPFEQPKGDSIFQKNVKTLFRKINQYFKTKYHYDNTSNQQDGSWVGTRQQNQENTANRKSQVYQNIKTMSSKGIGFSASDKSLPKDKKSIQTDLAQSDEIEQDDKKETNENVELQKSDIEKLNQKLSKRDKNGIINKIINAKQEETPKDVNNQVQGMDKQTTLDRVAGILRNSKKKQSQKLVIQINPPVDEPTQSTPHIKLDFQAIKKKNGNTEFVLDYNKKQESDSLESSNEDEDENDEDKNIDCFPNYFFQREQKIDSLKNFDFINRSQDSWDESFFSSQNMVMDQNDITQKGFYKNNINQNSDQRKKFSDDSQKQSKTNLEEQNTIDEKILSTLHFINHNSWRFVKNYQITYLEKQIDKGFLLKVQKLPDFLKNLKNKIDPTDGYKLENLIMPANNNIYKVFLKRDQKTRSLQNLILENGNKNQEIIDLSQIYLYEHKFQKDLVNDFEKKKQNEELSSSEESSNDSLDDQSESSLEEIDMETYFNLSDQDKDLSDKNQFIYDEEDYDVSRAQYLLKIGYLEPSNINESSNMFTQLNEQILPVQSGIDNEYINQILKSRGKNEKKIQSEIKQQSHIGNNFSRFYLFTYFSITEKKFRTINKMVNQLDLRSSQTDMKNIQSEYNELLEGDFEDNFKIDHDFYKKEFIKLQQHYQKNIKRKQLTIQGNKKVTDSQATANISINGSNIQNQQQKQQIKDRSPKSIPDLYDVITAKLKGQDNKQIQQYQNFSNSLPHYQQQQSNTLQSLHQQQQQLQLQQQQQQQYQAQHYQQLQQGNQSYNLQQNPSHIHSFIQQNTLPSNNIQYNIVPQQNQSITSSQRIPNPPEQVNPTPHIKNIFHKGFTQSLKSLNQNQNLINNGNPTLQYITGFPLKTEPNIRSQITIKNDEDQANLYKNISKINTPQSHKSDVHATSTIQSNYNKTSTLQSQQSIFNQSESLHNKDVVTIASQDNSKQGVNQFFENNKVSESQFILQKTNTNHSADENQLTAPSPSQISKQNIRTAGRKRSIFNTSNTDNQIQNTSQPQQQNNQEQNRNHHSPLSLHSPNFPYSQSGQNNNLPYFLSNKSISSKSTNQHSQTQQIIPSPLLPQNSIQNQTSIQQQPKTQMSFNPQNQSSMGYSNLNTYSQIQRPTNQQQQLKNPQQLSHGEVPSTPVRSPYRGGTIIQHALMNNIMQLNQSSQQFSLNHTNTSNANIGPFLQTYGSLGRQNSSQQSQIYPNTSNSPSNLNPQNQSLLQSNQLKPSPSQTQIDSLESKQVRSNRTFSSLTATKDLEKSTSMDRQNLVMRTRLQQNIRRSQMNQADQVFSAIKENNIHEIEDLLNQYHSLSLESKDEEGNTFIIIAAQVGSREIVEYLFQKGADINAQNNDGDTALHKANFYQYHIVADLLIQNGAQQNKLNNNGMNPWGCFPSSSKR